MKFEKMTGMFGDSYPFLFATTGIHQKCSLIPTISFNSLDSVTRRWQHSSPMRSG